MCKYYVQMMSKQTNSWLLCGRTVNENSTVNVNILISSQSARRVSANNPASLINLCHVKVCAHNLSLFNRIADI